MATSYLFGDIKVPTRQRVDPTQVALLLVAEHDGPTMFARIAMLRALHRHRPEPTPTPRQKRAKAYRIVQ